MITKEDFMEYENVRLSGVTNMFDVREVEDLAGLTKEQCIDIMQNYSKYYEQFMPKVKK